jgi:hypothetical protein
MFLIWLTSARDWKVQLIIAVEEQNTKTQKYRKKGNEKKKEQLKKIRQ